MKHFKVNMLLFAVTIALLMIVAPASAADFRENGDGTVTDNASKKMWQQGEGGFMSWRDAVNYCGKISLGGHDDWRLPTIDELRTLLVKGRGYPKIDTRFFRDFPATYVTYWSATETREDQSVAKALVFTFGSENTLIKTGQHRVRCVRDII